jgi:hypothetical protein
VAGQRAGQRREQHAPLTRSAANPLVPLWIKIAVTAFVAVLVPVYYRWWGLRNFLWFSDLALFATVVALWLESALVASAAALAVLLPEVVWNVGYFGRLLTGRDVGSLAAYMFDPRKPRYVRALSLFHVWLPPLLVWLVYALGYDQRALVATTLFAWVVLPLTWLVTDRGEESVNWVYGPPRIPELAYLGLVMLAFPLLVYLPTHILLRALFG